MRRKVMASVAGIVFVGVSLVGCSSTRRIDPAETGSWKIEGTSWYGFCQGRNAFIWVPSRNDADPDELEAVIYDDYRCVSKIEAARPSKSSKPDTDPDGVIDDED
jgi:hypothetical protein